VLNNFFTYFSHLLIIDFATGCLDKGQALMEEGKYEDAATLFMSALDDSTG
jgi:hypothetical protein